MDLKLSRKGIKFNLNCKIEHAAFIFRWLEKKKIFKTNFKSIERSKIFYSQFPNDQILNQNTLSALLGAVKKKNGKFDIDKLISKKPEVDWSKEVEYDSEPLNIVKHIHFCLSEIFLS